MRPGYFKVDQTATDSMFIFPGAFVGATSIADLRRWLDSRDITGKLVYVGAVQVEITEQGMVG